MADDEARMIAIAKTGGPPVQAELLRILGRLGPVDRLLIEALVADRDALRGALRPFAEAYRYTLPMGPSLRKAFFDAMCTGEKCTSQDWHRAAELVPEHKK
jgi:hypothetical protein